MTKHLNRNKMPDGWIGINEALPSRNIYVLGHTPFCKYKCAVVFYNGVNWRSADDKAEVWNINFWQYLPSVEGLNEQLNLF
jgi:hypothetical protein